MSIFLQYKLITANCRLRKVDNSLSLISQVANVQYILIVEQRVSRFAIVYGPETFNEPEEGNRSTEDAAKSGSCSVSVPSTTAESKTVATK